MLDALIEVSGMTADQVVSVSLNKLCPGILIEVGKGISNEKLIILLLGRILLHFGMSVINYGQKIMVLQWKTWAILMRMTFEEEK